MNSVYLILHKIYFLKEFSLKLIFGVILFSAIACRENKCQNHSATVHIEKTEEGYSLMRNGKPYYIKGGAAHAKYLTQLKNAGGNTARIYDTLYLQQTLDNAHALDLAVVVDIPLPKFDRDPEFYEDEKLFKIIKSKIGNTVKKFHDHPALLYWNLGNEIYYPYLYESTNFFSNYNELIDLIHTIDPNHPVSTSTIGANKSRVLSIKNKSPQLDFISFNSFGVLSKFSEKLAPISPIWDGPHVITEWGVNGPWEATLTSWKAPIEETSTKKAEQIRERYYNYIKPMKKTGSLGSFIFYWGKKNEITPSWYSLFGNDELKTEAVFELENIWKEKKEKYPGPELDYILLNDQGALDNIIIAPNSEAIAKIKLPDLRKQDISYTWEIRPESWYRKSESKIEPNINFSQNENAVNFNAPISEGPYRLFVYLTNDTEYYATANIPFYVLNPHNEE